MSTVSTTAADVMEDSSALLNDQAQTIFNNTNQIPYLNMAMRELQEYFELNEVPVTYNTSTEVAVNSGIIEIGFNTSPALPQDLIEIQQAWWRTRGIDPWYPFTRMDFIPHYLEGQPTSNPLYWQWVNQTFKILECNSDIDIKLDYVKTMFSEVTSPSDELAVINCRSFLSYRTASLAAEFVGENKTRADSLKQDALLALDRVLGINSRQQQAIIFRRRPFRSSYKQRSPFN